MLLLPLTVRAQLTNDEACGAVPMGRLELGGTLTLENATNQGAEGSEVGWYNEQTNFYSCRGTDSWNNTVYYRFELDEVITGVRVTITPRTASARLNAVLLAARKCEDIQFRDIERVSWSPNPGNACATQPGEAITIEDDCLIHPGGNPIESVHRVSALLGTCESEAVEVVASAYPVPPARITTDTTLIALGPSLTLNALGPSLTLNAPPDPSYRYRWTPAQSLDNDTVASPLATPEDNTTYTLTITTPEGCSSSASVEIIVQKVLLIPNTFTPNGDGVNDTWVITNLERFPNSTLRIFDRWGQTVLESTNYDQSWQGRFRGQDLPEDTYFYLLDQGNGDPPRCGSLTIIR